jgi:hypothetical protein
MSAKSLKNPEYYSKVISNLISSTELDSIERLERIDEVDDIVEEGEEDKKEI